MALLEIEDLRIDFAMGRDTVHALRGVTFSLPERSRTAVVGESGSGKTISAIAAMGLLPDNAHVAAGAIRFEGADILGADEGALAGLRGDRLCMIFQNPLASLNPLLPVGRQIADVYRRHNGGTVDQAWAQAVEALAATGIADPERRARNYPHEYSGGMAQRAMIAMALLCKPDLIIADEPTSGLDLTIQIQVMDLIEKAAEATGAALLLITHDIGLVTPRCDHLVVMYAGTVMEAGTVEEVTARPANPYTALLLACFDDAAADEMRFIPGRVPDLRFVLPGCPFADRCPRAEDICLTTPPPRVEVSAGHVSRCHFAR